MNRPAAFLDRDGTINVDKEYLFRPEECEYLDGAIEGLRTLEEFGYLLVIITNQSGIARGYYKEDDYYHFMDWMISNLEKHGVHIAGSFFCPHLKGAQIPTYDVDCNCRKPATGLFYKAKEELGIDLDRSIAIGDRVRDLSICQETKARGILLGGDPVPTYFDYDICDNWKQVIDLLTDRGEGTCLHMKKLEK